MDAGDLFAGRYRLKGQLGQGGSGDVWLARDENRDFDVALKLYRVPVPLVAYNEARRLTELESHNILKVHDAWQVRDIPYLATEVAQFGTTADQLSPAPFGLPAQRVLIWIRQMLVGLGVCHDRGLLHRDLKPSNLFLNSPDWALLGDFGLIHPLDGAGQAPAGGTPITAAPELFMTGTMTKRSDLYSVGVTAWCLLTGSWPFDDDDPADLQAQIVGGAIPRLRDSAPHLSGRLAQRIERAMARDPDRRYSDWRQLRIELSRSALAGRTWSRIAPHPDHMSCWIELDATHGVPLAVCVEANGLGGYDVETRYQGTGRRLREQCPRAIPEAKLPAALKRVFDSV